MKLLGKCSILLLFALLIPSLVMSQTASGIRGVVKDDSGAVIPGVSITATHKATGTARQAVSDDTGTYTFTNMNAGEYDVKSELTSFQSQVQTVTVTTGSTANLDFKLKVGASSEVVQVTGQAAQVNTTEYKIDGVVNRDRIENLPLNGRSFMALALLEPGVSAEYTTTPQWQGNSSFRVSVGGTDSSTTRISVDGASIVDRLGGGTTQNFSQDSVEEFQISTYNFDLSSGTSGSGNVNIVSRTGANAFHGGGLMFYRDQNMAAYPAMRRPCDPLIAPGHVVDGACATESNPLRTQFENPPFVRRQSGFNFGGPIKKDKTFFFSNFEYTNQVGAYSVAYTDPVFQGYNHIANAPYTGKVFNIRFDHKINAKHTAFLRLSSDKNDSVQAGFANGLVQLESNWQEGHNDAKQAAMGINSVLTPRLVNDFKLSDSYLQEHLNVYAATHCNTPRYCFDLGGPYISGFGFATTIGVPTNVEQHRLQRVYQPSDNVFWNKGNHAIRFGGLLERLSMDGYWQRTARGQFALFTPAQVKTGNKALYDALPASLKIETPNRGVPTFADMLTLPVNGFMSIGIGDPDWWSPYNNADKHHSSAWRFYAQDSWRMRPNFTVSYGLSWSFESNFWTYDMTVPQFLKPVFGNADLGQTQRPAKDFAPALGLSWSPGSDKKTVIRAGSGLYYSQSNFIWRQTNERNLLGPQGNGWAQATTATLPNPLFGQPGQPATLVAVSPTALSGQNFMDLLPGIKQRLIEQWGNPADAAKKDLTGPRGIEFLHQATQGDILGDDKWITPRTIHFTGGIQREVMKNLVVSADFVMRRGLHSGVAETPTITWDANHFFKPAEGSVTDPVTGAVTWPGVSGVKRDPVIPVCPTTELKNIVAVPCSTNRIQLTLPVQSSRYTGLLVKVDRRFSGRLQFTASWAHSRYTSDNITNASYFQDCRACTYGINSGDRPNRFTFNALYEIPTLKGGNRWTKPITDGWTISSIFEADSAPPMNVVVASVFDYNGDGLSTKVLPGMAFQDYGRGLDDAGLRALVAQYNATYPTPPNADGTFPVFRKRTPENQIIPYLTLPDKIQSGDTFKSFDMRLTKAIKVREAVQISLAVEGFNIFNFSNLFAYQNTLNVANFGTPSDRIAQVFGTGGPRAFQISAKLRF